MKRFMVVLCCLNVALLSDRVFQHLSARADGAASAGSGAGTPEVAGNGDVNGNGSIDIADASYLLNWLFLGGPAPAACAQTGTLESRVAALEDVVEHFSVEAGPTVVLSGANLQIVNGLGATNGKPSDPGDVVETNANGLGNLIVGYQELRVDGENDRGGSHNLVVGSEHNFSGVGSVVVGKRNTVGASYGAVICGTFNETEGVFASVTGGSFNTASGQASSIHGGGGFFLKPGGGFNLDSGNRAEGNFSSICGGTGNRTLGENATIVSGGTQNVAAGFASTISGGSSNRANGENSTVSGGNGRTASADDAHVP